MCRLREMRPKKELIRVVKSPEGAISLDFRGKLPGRGAYLVPGQRVSGPGKKVQGSGAGFRPGDPPEVYERWRSR